MKSLFKKVIFATFVLSLFLSAGNALAVNNLRCTQLEQNLTCVINTDTAIKNLFNTWIGENQNNSITVELLAENKLISRKTFFQSDNYSFNNVPINTLLSNGIKIPNNVNFSTNIFKSGPNASSSTPIYISSTNTSIINNATISITKNCQGLVCDFKANVSGLSSGISASSYKWNFEGVEMSNSPANMSYTFTRAGTYNVKLTVFYNNGSSGFTSASVNVLNSESTGTAGADNFSCSQTGVSVDCTVEIIASRKNLINNALSNGLNIGIIISADNKKVLSSPISRADNKYVYNIPISTLTNNSILLPKNVTFNVKIQESSNILIYDKSFSLQVDSGTNIDSGFGSINQNTTNQGSNDGAGLENTANTNSAQQRQQQNYFNKFLNISQTTGGVSGPTTVSGIADIFLTILQWIFAFALILGIIMVIISGISYMTATGDSTRVGKATNILIYSVIGVAIALISSFVIQIIRGLLS